MEKLKQIYGEWCLIAGAAEGLGRAFAESAARKGMGVILVDVQEGLLEEFGSRLERSHGIPVRLLHLDLAREKASEVMMKMIGEYSCRLVIYNAAYSRVKRFLENDPPELDRYVQVNMRTPMQLIHAYAAHYRNGPEVRKGLILMSSLAGSWGTRLLGPYGATKAFTQILAESLNIELEPDGFDVLVSITGATATPGYLSSLPGKRTPPGGIMDPESVAEECYRALGQRSYVIPGSRNRIAYFMLTRVLPRKHSLRIMNRQVEKLYR
jgi:short-subunit dehydrogenase